MTNCDATEHFVTLFDKNFLPQGMALHHSLCRHSATAQLWVVCLDEQVEQHLSQLNLDRLTLIPLCAMEQEHPRLIQARSDRNWRSYCWTLSPFVLQAVFDREPSARRVTYLDADLFFFDNPDILLRELDTSDRHVQITEHAYAPEYDQSRISGRFCVQFLTFDCSPQARRVMTWWQDRCVEWCHDDLENGQFGDQKYLDQWPQLFGPIVHIVRQVEKTLAPWNVRHFSNCGTENALTPVFYHFHGLRIVSPRRALLYEYYRVSEAGLRLYRDYTAVLFDCLDRLRHHGIPVPLFPLPVLKAPHWLKRAITRIRQLRGHIGGQVFGDLAASRPALESAGRAFDVEVKPGACERVRAEQVPQSRPNTSSLY